MTHTNKEPRSSIWAGFHYASPLVTLPPSSFHFSFSPSCILPPLPPVTRDPTQETTRAIQSQMYIHPTVALCPWSHSILLCDTPTKPFIVLNPFSLDKMFAVCLLKGLAHQNDKNTFSLLPIVLSSHGDRFSFTCLGFEISLSRNNVWIIHRPCCQQFI